MRIANTIVNRPVPELKPHPKNNYYHSPLADYDRLSLKNSIEKNGIMEPILITTDDVIVSGHQRWEIATEISMQEVPTRLLEGTEDEIEILIVTSNTDRRHNEKNLMKKARQAQRLCERSGITHGGVRNPQAILDQLNQDGVAKKLGIDARTLRRLIKLLTLIEELQHMIEEGVLGLYAGNQLAALNQEQQKLAFHMLYNYEPTEITLDLVKDLCGRITGEVTEESELRQEAGTAEEKSTKPKTTRTKLSKFEKQIRKLRDELMEDEKEEVVNKLHDIIDQVMRGVS